MALLAALLFQKRVVHEERDGVMQDLTSPFDEGLGVEREGEVGHYSILNCHRCEEIPMRRMWRTPFPNPLPFRFRHRRTAQGIF